jgi:GrpB-like predicted nucleotidyltransferase (UPF0157 family)
MTPDKMLKREYSIEGYNPNWILKFQEIKKLLEQVFKGKALQIEHVGSTSIVGMKSKPLIDVLVTVSKMEPFTEEREIMSSHGYKNGDNYIEPDSIIFYKEEGSRKTENIHVCVENSSKARQFIDTRDYLRNNPKRTEKYSELKEELKKKFPDDYPAYRAGKQSFLDETEELARAWKAESVS